MARIQKITTYKKILIGLVSISLISIFIISANQSIICNNVAHANERDDSLEFVYQPKTDVSVGDRIDVCIGFNDKAEHPDATLNYHKIGTDQSFSTKVTCCVDEMAFFEISTFSNDQIGCYLYDDIVWYDSTTQEIIKQKIDENTKVGYSFSVNEKIDASTSESTPASIYTLDEDGLKECANVNNLSDTQLMMSQDVYKNKYLECLAQGNSFNIALDAGHGGSESGACYGGHCEKDLNWRIACACQNELNKYMGVSVFMVRTGDEYVGLKERADRALNGGANLFVSLHNNSGGGTGCEVWVQHSGGWHSEFNSIGCEIGSRINQKLSSTFGFNNRGLKERYCTDGSRYPDGTLGDYYSVLYWSRNYSIPGILVEHAFMDGPGPDQSALYNDANLDTMGCLDAQAIAEYYNFQKDAPKPYVKRMEEGKTTIEWKAIQNAEKYAIAKLVNGKWDTYTLDCAATSYDVFDLKNGAEYTFLVQAYVNGRWSSFTEKNYLIFRQLPCPKVSWKASGDGEITLTWSKLSGASQYAIAEYYDGEFHTYTTEFFPESYPAKFKISNLECGVKHQFLVQGYINSEYWSSNDSQYFVDTVPKGREKPYDFETTPYVMSCDISWHAVPGALGYAVAIMQPDGKWKTLTYDCPETQYTIEELGSGRNYTALVQAKFRNNRYSTFDKTDYVNFKTIDVRPHVKAVPGGDGEVKLTWDNEWESSKFSVNEYKDGKLINITEECHETNYTVKNLSNEVEHKFIVLANYWGYWTNYDENDAAACTPHGHVKPYNLEVINPTINSITLIWGKVSGATKYAVAIFNEDGSYKTYTNNCTNTKYTITGLNDSMDYKCLVQANIDGNWSNFTEDDFVIGTTVDFRPKPYVESIGDGLVKLKWEPIQGANLYAIAEKIDNNTYNTFTLECKNTNYEISNLSNNREHTFVVQSFCNGRWSRLDQSRFVTATPIGHVKPYNVTAIPGYSSIRLNWHSVPGATSYAIATKNTNGSYTTYTYDCRATSFVIQGLETDKPYKCLVQANIDGKWSNFTESDLVTTKTLCSKPKVKVISTGDGVVNLEWDIIEGSTKYAIAEVVGDKFVNKSTECKSNHFSVDNLANEKPHTFLVQSNIDGSWSPFNSDDYVTSTPHGHIKPYNISCVAGYTSLQFDWDAVAGASAYAVATRNEDGTFHNYTTDLKDTSYTIKGLISGKVYRCLIQANIDGRWSAFDEGDLVTIRTRNTKPLPTVESVGDGTVKLKWSFIEGATNYAIAEYKDGKYNTFTKECKNNSYTITGLSNQKPHYFVVQSFIGGSWSPFTEADLVSATPKGAIKPVINSVTPAINSLTINWSLVSGASRYAVALSTDNGATFKTYTYDCKQTSFTINAIKSGIEYCCLVQAEIDGQWSKFNSSDLVKAVPTVDPLRPRPSITGTSAGRMDLTWEPIAGATSYAIATKNADGSFHTYTTSCTACSYSIVGLTGGTYSVLVQAFVGNRWSKFDDGDLVSAFVPSPSGHLIMNAATTYVDQMVRCYHSSGHAYPSNVYANRGASDIQTFCQICYNEACFEGVDPAVLFCQAMHETGWLQFGGQVLPEQCNFGGLGATDGGARGASFPDVRTGLRAQVQHLKAYGSTDGLRNPCVDPRFHLVSRGCAPLVEDLGGRWATGSDYGYRLVAHMNDLYQK